MKKVSGFYNITLPLPPVGWKRPYFNKKTGAIFNSNKESINTLVPFIIDHLKGHHPDPTIWEAPIEIRLGFVFKRPLLHLKSRDKKSLPFFASRTPDIDNLCKLILDLFSKRIIEDDKQVVKLSAVKKWGDEGCVHVSYKISVPTSNLI